jgi:hypothetical protein
VDECIFLQLERVAAKLAIVRSTLRKAKPKADERSVKHECLAANWRNRCVFRWLVEASFALPGETSVGRRVDEQLAGFKLKNGSICFANFACPKQ